MKNERDFVIAIKTSLTRKENETITGEESLYGYGRCFQKVF